MRVFPLRGEGDSAAAQAFGDTASRGSDLQPAGEGVVFVVE